MAMRHLTVITMCMFLAGCLEGAGVRVGTEALNLIGSQFLDGASDERANSLLDPKKWCVVNEERVDIPTSEECRKAGGLFHYEIHPCFGDATVGRKAGRCW